MSKTKILLEPGTSASAMSASGLSEDIIRKAIELGVRTYKKATPFHPKTHGGSSAWGEVVASIRQDLKLKGWSLLDQNGLSMVCHKDSGISIVISSGDKQTGLEDGFPSSRNSKGAATSNFIDLNYDLFKDEIVSSEEQADLSKTYVLLYFFDFDKKEARFELSLPTEMNAKGYIKGWKERMIFGPISLNAEPKFEDDARAEFNDDVDIDILKKA